MKVKDLIKELSFFDDEDDVLAYLYDKESDIEYECDFNVDGDIVPLLNLEEIKEKFNTDLADFKEVEVKNEN